MPMEIAASTEEKMKAVKAAWDKAPDGPKKAAALKHYQAAEEAMSARHDTDTVTALDAAALALT